MTENLTPTSRRHGIPFDMSPLGECALGDVIGLPDGRTLTVRSIALLERAVATLAGFVILGECEYLVGAPATNRSPHTVYLPVGSLAAARGGHVVVEGAVAYWAPHLPALAGAMGELTFRVLDVPGSLDPWIVIHRGPETLVFVRTGEIDAGAFRITRMPRPHGADVIEVVRHAAVVTPLPHQVPAPQVPVAEPVAQPVAVPVN